MFKFLDDRLCNTWIGQSIKRLFSHFSFFLMKYYKRRQDLTVITQVFKEERPFLFNPSELFMVQSLAKAQRSVEGEYAEVGVFKGASAKTICEVKEDKALHLFDTFEGMPDTDSLDSRFRRHMFTGKLESVKKRLEKYNNVHFYKGLFPSTATPVQDKKFSFVHLDVDIYQSTADCLEFFYSRMHSGGIILSHDFSQAAGVRQAFTEFFQDKPESIIELSITQCMVIKR